MIRYILVYSTMLVAWLSPILMIVWSYELSDKLSDNILRTKFATDSTNIAQIRRYKLDSLRLELAIIEADMRNDSALQAIRAKLKHTKP